MAVRSNAPPPNKRNNNNNYNNNRSLLTDRCCRAMLPVCCRCAAVRLVLLFVFCSVLYLLIWHGYLVAGNVTTIEYFQVNHERM